MANTWRATMQTGAYGISRSLLDVFNAGASRVIRVYRMVILNSAETSGTGVLGAMSIYRTTGASAGTAVTPFTHDSNNSALDAAITAGYLRTTTNSAKLRQLLYQGGAPGFEVLDARTLYTLVSFTEVWNAGFADTNVQPLTCPSGGSYGYNMYNEATSLSGFFDAEIEFTDAGS